MHITELSGNITSPDGQPWSFPLSSKVLIVGGNGAGKTRILHGLNLVLRGATDDLLGKNNVKSPQALFTLAPFTGAGELFVHADFDTGVEGAWGTERLDDGTIKKPTHEPPVGVNLAACFPLASVKDALSGDDNARKTFLGWIAKDIGAEDVLACIPTTVQEAFRAIYDRQQGNVIDKLNATRDYAQARASEIAAEAASAAMVVAATEANLEPRPAPNAIAEVRAALAAWQEARGRAVRFEEWTRGAQARAEAVQAQAVQQAERETAASALAQWVAYEASLAAPVLDIPAAPANSEKMAQAATLLAGHGDQCPACGANPGFEHIEAWRLFYEQSIAEYRSRQASAQQAHAAAMAQHNQQIRQAREQIAKWQARKHAAEMALARLGGACAPSEAPPDPQVTVAACDQSIATLTASLEHMLRIEGAWSAVTTVETGAASTKGDRTVFDAIAGACKIAVNSLLDAHVEAFSALVQKHLPAEWVFRLDTENGFAIGYTRGDMHHRALSGAERDALLVAIAMAVAELGGEGADGKKPKRKSRIKQHEARVAAPYQIVIPEDRERRADTLARLMRAWTPYEGQVVLTSTKLPKGGVPKGWTVVDLDAWHKERGTTPGAMVAGGDAEGTDDEGENGGEAPEPLDAADAPNDGGIAAATPTNGHEPNGHGTNGAGAGFLPPPSMFPGMPPAPAPTALVEAPTEPEAPAVEEWYYHEATASYITLTAAEAATAPDMEYVGDDAARQAHEQAQMDRPTYPEGILASLGYDAEQVAMLPVGSIRRDYLEKNRIPVERVEVTSTAVAVKDGNGNILIRMEA